MIWPILGFCFFLSTFMVIMLIICSLSKPKLWIKNKKSIALIYLIWFTIYGIFFLFFTGPLNLDQYPKAEDSPYKLPWKAGVSRFVAQGNRSFTSHREDHLHAWDFVMPNGTEILAARDGLVIEVKDQFSGVGLNSNLIIIKHSDGQRSGYFHIRKNSSFVKLNEEVKQGQPIALSGMVGQTVFPHLHFCIFNKDGSASIPMSFSDVPGGPPLAGRFYTSGNLTN